jgi:hypothetical protein
MNNEKIDCFGVCEKAVKLPNQKEPGCAIKNGKNT